MSKLNKIILSKVIFGLAILFLLLFPFYRIGINFPTFLYNNILIDARFFVAGFFFLIFCILSLLYSLNVKSKKSSSKLVYFGKTVNAIFVDSILIYLSASGYISYLVPVVIVVYDLVVAIIINILLFNGQSFELKTADNIKNATCLIGIFLILFYNLPFELIGLKIADAFLYFASFMAVFAGFEFYFTYKKNLQLFVEAEK